MESTRQILFVIALSFLFMHTASQTLCSVKVPVPDLGYCQAVGSIEEHLERSIFETTGRVQMMKDYGFEAFNLLKEQIRKMNEDSTNTERYIRKTEQEIVALKTFLPTLKDVHTKMLALKDEQHDRGKRAALSLSDPVQLLLDKTKQNFQEHLAGVMKDLQVLSKSITDEITRNYLFQTKLQNDIKANQMSIDDVERQLRTFGNLTNSIKTGVSPMQQEVTQLIFNATLVEQLAQRQLDYIDRQEKKVESLVTKTDADIPSVRKDVAAMGIQAQNITTQFTNTKDAQEILKNQTLREITNTNTILANTTHQLRVLQQNITQVGRQVTTATIELAAFARGINATSKEMEGMQSIILFSKRLQNVQSGDIIHLKRDIIDDINIMKFAFGLINKLP